VPVTSDDKIGDRHSWAYRPLIIEAPRERSNAKLSPFPVGKEEGGEVFADEQKQTIIRFIAARDRAE